MVSKRAYVKITPKDPHVRFGRVIKDFTNEYRKIIEGIEPQALSLIRENTPKKTGNTAAAWKSRSSVSRSLEGKIELSNPLPQSRYLDQGTNPSPGRYIPNLERRLVTEQIGLGMHPGITGTKYIGRTTKEIQNRITGELKKLARKMNISIRRRGFR